MSATLIRYLADYAYPTLVGYQRCIIFLSFMYTLLYPGHNEN
jgi:hypothetical protein